MIFSHAIRITTRTQIHSVTKFRSSITSQYHVPDKLSLLYLFIRNIFPAKGLLFFFLTSLLEYNCFTMVCQFLLYNKLNQLYIYIYPHISSLLCLPPIFPIPPLQVGTKHQADLPLLCGCFPLAIYFTFGSVYMSMPLSHFVPPYPSHSPYPQVHSLCLRLYACPAPRFFRTSFFFFFLDSIYMCQHTVFVFLFLTYFTLYDRLQVHPPHYK